MMCWTRVIAESIREVGGVDSYCRWLSQQQMVIFQIRKLNEKVVKNISQVSERRNQVDRRFICQKRKCQRKDRLKGNILILVI